MMYRKIAVSLALVVALVSLDLTAQAQRRRPVTRSRTTTTATTGDRTLQIIRRLEISADRFRISFAQSLDQSRYGGTNREDNISNVVEDFQHVIGHLRERYDRRQLLAADVEAALVRASRIDNFMQRNRTSVVAQRDWSAVKADLNELARNYNVAWRQDVQTYPNYPPENQAQGTYGYDSRLTGTYRLNTTQSENPRNEAERVTRNLPYNERQRVYDQVLRRLEPPEQLAVERRGSNVSIASTRAPQISFVADGRENTESTAGGNTVNVRATFYGDQLTVSTRGDRGNDFTVTFDPLDDGRRLQVTRRINVEQLREPVVVRSIYDRTSDIAQFNIYDETRRFPDSAGRFPDNSRRFPSDTGRASDDFIVPDGERIVAELDRELSTKQTRENERFTLRVREPSQYQGATLEGYVSQVSRSGRISGRSGMTLNFDRIRLRDGRTYRFAGVVENVRTQTGENVRVDNEGTVEENKSQTEQTAQRAAIGTAVGAIIGAIAGGGKGAAIGAILGAGAGAGSIYVQGSDDLELRSGTEVTIRASSPGARGLR